MSTAREAVLPASYAFYDRRNLQHYNLWVLGYNCRFVWHCPRQRLERLFLDHATRVHCDIGIGTGFFLEQVHREKPFSSVHLVDGNPDCIDWVRSRLAGAAITSQCEDVMEGDLQVPEIPADSVSANFVLHCLRGPLERKRRLFANARRVARPGAVIFGSTILGSGGKHGTSARWLLRHFNRIGVFDTAGDSLQAVQTVLNAEVADLQTVIAGSVLMFRGTLR